MVEQADCVGTHFRKPIHGRVVRLVAMSVAARVVGDNAASARDPLNHPSLHPMLFRAGAEAMDHQHRDAVAMFHVMNFYAIGIKEGHRGASW
jgi:hypothetical protein